MIRLRIFWQWLKLTHSVRIAYWAGFKMWAKEAAETTNPITEHRKTCNIPPYQCPECERLSHP